MYLSNVVNTFTLSLRENGTYTPFSAEAWEYAGQMTLLGMLMVFSVLAILWGVLVIFKFIFAPRKKKIAQTDEKKEEISQAAVLTEEIASEPDDTELVAVITAAIAAYMSEESGREITADGFRVVSFYKANNRRSWNSK